jgi:hypothetical protein
VRHDNEMQAQRNALGDASDTTSKEGGLTVYVSGGGGK